MGCIGIKVFLRQTHFIKVFAGGAVQHDRVGGRQVIGCDVVSQHGKWPKVRQRPGPSKGALPIGRPSDVGAVGSPIIKWWRHVGHVFDLDKHWVIDLSEMLGLDAGCNNGVNFFIARPDVFQCDWIAGRIMSEDVLLDIKANRARNRVSHNQRR